MERLDLVWVVSDNLGGVNLIEFIGIFFGKLEMFMYIGAAVMIWSLFMSYLVWPLLTNY